MPIEAPGVVLEDPRFVVEARRLDHGPDTYGYRLTEPDGRRVLPQRCAALGVRGPAIGELMRTGEVVVDGRRVTREEVSVDKPGQSFAFVMDTRRCDACVELVQGSG